MYHRKNYNEDRARAREKAIEFFREECVTNPRVKTGAVFVNGLVDGYDRSWSAKFVNGNCVDVKLADEINW